MDHQRLEPGQRYHAHGQLPRRRLRGLHLHRRLQLGHVPELVQLADVLAGFQEGVQRAREHRQAALYRRNLKLREGRQQGRMDYRHVRALRHGLLARFRGDVVQPEQGSERGRLGTQYLAGRR